MLLGDKGTLIWVEESLSGSLGTDRGGVTLELVRDTNFPIYGFVNGKFGQTDGGLVGLSEIDAHGAAGAYVKGKVDDDHTSETVEVTSLNCQSITGSLNGVLSRRIAWMPLDPNNPGRYDLNMSSWNFKAKLVKDPIEPIWAKIKTRLDAVPTDKLDRAGRQHFLDESQAVFSEINGHSELSDEDRNCLEHLFMEWWSPRDQKIRTKIVDDIIAVARTRPRPNAAALPPLLREWLTHEALAERFGCPCSFEELARTGKDLDQAITVLIAAHDCYAAALIYSYMRKVHIPSDKSSNLMECTLPPATNEGQWANGNAAGMLATHKALNDAQAHWVATGDPAQVDAIKAFLATKGYTLEGVAK
jgi:hypothetical protein